MNISERLYNRGSEMGAISLSVLFWVVILALCPSHMGFGEEIAPSQAIGRLFGRRSAGEIDDGQMEAALLDLLPRYSQPAERGEIYAALAGTAASGINSNETKRAARVIDYCKQAVSLPIDPVTESRVYQTWVSTLRASAWPGQPDTRTRREMMGILLRAIRRASSQLTHEKRQVLPMGAPMGSGGYAADDPRRKLEEAERVRLNKERATAVLQDNLLMQRWLLTSTLAQMCPTDPKSRKEFEAMVVKQLGDTSEARDVMEATKAPQEWLKKKLTED